MGGVAIVFGSSRFIKKTLLDYCFTHFDEEQIWLVDSLQIFDPYYLSSVNVSRTRGMLYAIRVSRPFTFYQLHDKIAGFSRMPIDWRSTIIISGMDCFGDDASRDEERTAITDHMLRVLLRVHEETRCTMLIGCKTPAMRDQLITIFNASTASSSEQELEQKRRVPAFGMFTKTFKSERAEQVRTLNVFVWEEQSFQFGTKLKPSLTSFASTSSACA